MRPLLEFLEDVTRSVDDDIAVDVMFLDFQKAFDKVPHQRLLLKLEGLGLIRRNFKFLHYKDIVYKKVRRHLGYAIFRLFG